jgi:hypothetical protein
VKLRYEPLRTDSLSHHAAQGSSTHK